MSQTNESNVPAPSPGATTTAVPASSTPAAGSGVNRRKARTFSGRPIIAPGTAPEEPPSAQVLDDNLDEDDLRVSIAVTVTGRTTQFATLKFDRTVHGAMQNENRGVFFQELEHLLKEIRQAIATRVNRKLSSSTKPKAENPNGNGHYSGELDTPFGQAATGSSSHSEKPPLFITPLPPFVDSEEQAEIPDFLRIHQYPGLDAR